MRPLSAWRFSVSAGCNDYQSRDLPSTTSPPAGCGYASCGQCTRPRHVDDGRAHIGIGAGITFYNPSKENGQTSNGLQEQHLKADTFELTAGLTVGVWGKKQ